MAFEMKAHTRKEQPNLRIVIRVALVLSALIVAVGAWRCLIAADSCSLAALLLTADQHGQRLYQQGDYTAAARSPCVRTGTLPPPIAALQPNGQSD